MTGSDFTASERQLARERVKAWPTGERRFLIGLQPREAELVGLAVALLDLRPVSDAPPHKDGPA